MSTEPKLTITYNVVAYDASWGGYGDDRSKDGFIGPAEAVAYAKSLPASYGATAWKKVVMQPILTQLYGAPEGE